jgi:hypothetical protein
MTTNSTGAAQPHEHRIKLRGGWEWAEADRPDERRRLTLPTRFEPGRHGRVILYRQFHRPSLSAGESVWLEFARIPGVQSITLNGRYICEDGEVESTLAVELTESRMHDLIVLEVDLGRATTPLTDDWGAISLVIRGAAER